MTTPPVPLNEAVLTLFSHADTKRQPDASDLWLSLVSRLSRGDAKLLPASIERVMPLLEGDRDRLMLAVRVVTSFDIYEAAPALLTLAHRTGSSDIALAAATFARHPGVAPSTRALIEDLAERVSLSPRQLQAFRIRTDPTYPADDSRAHELRTAVWPGTTTTPAPLVAVAEAHAPADLAFLLLGNLVRSRFRTRRIPDQWQQSPPREWFGKGTRVISWDAHLLSHMRQYGFDLSQMQVIQGPRTIREMGRVLLQVGATDLASSDEQSIGMELDSRVLSPRLLELGALDIREMAYLGGGTLSSLHGLAGAGALQPRYLPRGRSTLWSFAQLIAYRTWRYFSARSQLSRFPGRLVSELEQLASAKHVTELGLGADGRLLERINDAWFDRDTGQEVIEGALAIDPVFRPFHLGKGTVPDLVNPSVSTSVNPSVLGGTPVLRRSRVAARALAEFERDQSREAVINAFQELDPVEIDDAIRVGADLLAVK